MRQLAVLVALLALPATVNATAKIDTVWDQHCSKNGSMAVRGKNMNSFAVDMRLCLKRTTGRWTCWVAYDVEPGEWESNQTDDSPWGYYVCNADGEYFWSTRRAGMTSVRFDDPPGYNN